MPLTKSLTPDPHQTGGASHRPTQTRIRLCISHRYQQEPVISSLTANHGVTVNITAALLASGGGDDGWFDLLLQGAEAAIESALIYLNELDLEIWYDTENVPDGW